MKSRELFVAYFDILGFAKFLETSEPDTVVEVINKIFSISALISMAHVATTRKNTYLDDANKKQPHKIKMTKDGQQVAIPNLDDATINSIIIFDSVVFWTSNNYEDDLYDLIDTITIFMRFMFTCGFPVRGAVAYGDFLYSGGSIQSSSIVQHFVLASKAQANAMRLESKQEWAGCVLHKSVIDRCEDVSISLDKLEQTRRIIKYPVPFSSSNEGSVTQEMYALIWLGQKEEYIPEKKIADIESVIRDAFSSQGKQIGRREEVKITNTAKFVNFTCPIPITETV